MQLQLCVSELECKLSLTMLSGNLFYMYSVKNKNLFKNLNRVISHWISNI